MTIAEQFAPAEARDKERVMQNTWGHLAPEKNKAYDGHFVYAVGCFGADDLNPTVIAFEFGDLDSSPWLHEALCDFVRSQKSKSGDVCRFDGKFKNYKFIGTIKTISHYGV